LDKQETFRMIASVYTTTLADRILGELRAGRSLQEICGDDGMPHHDTVLNWVKHDRDGFAARYRQARRCGHGGPAMSATAAQSPTGFSAR
jgi:hypothetical protein